MIKQTLIVFSLGLSLFSFACTPLSPIHQARVQSRPHSAVPPLRNGPPATIQINELRVLLRSGKQGLRVGAPGGIHLVDSGKILASLSAKQSGKLRAKSGRLYYQGSALPAKALKLLPTVKNQKIKVSGDVYRGDLIIRAEGNRMLLINEVSLDEYLYGVLSSEVPPQWPEEALRAQAVAARTYALFRADSTPNPYYDLDDSTHSQVYSGTKKEHARTTKAVDDTQGLILTWRGEPAQAFFHSNCGGYTAAARDVWGTDIQYLRGVRDLHCRNEKHATWEAKLSVKETQRRLSAASKLKGTLEKITPYDEDYSKRWRHVRIDGKKGTVRVKSSSFRMALGADVLRSTRFNISQNRRNILFKGRGWGHGIGLCQEGAFAKARKGWKFKRILHAYYPGTRLQVFEDF